MNKLLLLVIYLTQVFANYATPKVEVITTKCEFFNASSCIGPGCQKIEECEASNEMKSHCFVVWSLAKDGKVTVALKGCILNHESCDKPTCVDSTHVKSPTKFCCCEGDLCNRSFSYEPSEVEENEVQSSKDGHLVTYVIVACTIVIVLSLKIFAFFFVKPCGIQETEFKLIDESSPCLEKRPIELIQTMGEGRFGAVWKAKLKNEYVAVKIFPIQEKQSWLVEQDIFELNHMNHVNILHYIGVEEHIENEKAEFWLITAYHELGSLYDFLHANTLTWEEMCIIVETMTRGLYHLHEAIFNEPSKPAIAHRDFKSKNVLLKSNMTACIADFGMAIVFEPGKSCGKTHGQIGTTRYMAPEVLEGAIDFTPDSFLKIDMYACGLVLWELVSRCTEQGCDVPDYKMPFEEELGEHIPLDKLRSLVVYQKARPKIPLHWRTKLGLGSMCETIEDCWDQDADARLSAACVMERAIMLKNHKEPPLRRYIETEIEMSTIKERLENGENL